MPDLVCRLGNPPGAHVRWNSVTADQLTTTSHGYPAPEPRIISVRFTEMVLPGPSCWCTMEANMASQRADLDTSARTGGGCQ